MSSRDGARMVTRVAHIQLPEGLPGIRGLLAFRPETAKALGELADALLHAPGTLTTAEREMIAAYVSQLNDCRYCYASHMAIAVCHLQDEAVVDSVMQDAESAPIPAKLKALLAVAAKVQRSGKAVQAEDIARARAEGATDLEIHDTVLIAALFCMYNRYVDGLDTWTPTDPNGYRERAKAIAAYGYSAAVPQTGPVSPPIHPLK